MKLGKNIQELRKQHGLSQEKLAEKIEVTRQTISNWELGSTFPNPEQLILLSKTFGKSIDELVGNEAFENIEEEIEKNDNLQNIGVALAIICGSIAGIWAYSANRFRIDEILGIAAIGAVVGICIGIVFRSVLKYNKG